MRDWESYLSWRKERQARACVFRALLAAGVWLLRSDHQACSQGLSSQVRAVCPLHLPSLANTSLANTFLGERSTARGEGGFRSVSAPQRGAMLGSPSRGHLAPPMGVPCWGHLAKGTWHLPWACHAGVTQLRAPGTSHGRAMLGSPSRGHLAPPMGPRRTVAGGALACEKPNRRAQLALVEGSKQPREAFAGSCWPALR